MNTSSQQRVGKPEFKPDYVSPKRSPLAPPTYQDFDWNEVERELGELPEDARADVAEVIRKIFLWVTAVKMNGKNAPKKVGRRFIALAWVIDPSLFDGSPSLETLGKQIGNHHLWKMTGKVSKEFGITNAAQNHAWNRGKAS